MDKIMNTAYVEPPAAGLELGVTGQAVRNMIHRGELPALRVGRRFKIRREDLDAYLAGAMVVV
ncbi:excisionase family DNA-binding protein [Mycobacterium sp. 155]|uniref:excisionase family DNA-binding protein n=1 Tax=Mycobacterium sp. 155 TaxID=1157943 RepID=UPI000379CFC7|nr:excisionase family DNA-binding protein [Mycobacterium sp. 155]